MHEIRARHRSQTVRVGLGAVLALVLVVSVACGNSTSSQGKQPTTTSLGNGTTADTNTGEVQSAGFNLADFAGLSANIKGSGSSFQQNYNLATIDLLHTVLPELKITYAGGGSGQGKSDLADGVVDFAGTDSLVKPEDAAKYNGQVLYFPTVVAPITVSYELDGVHELRLDGPALAQIFSAKITSWNDEAIAVLNPQTELPAIPITVCRRADASGTTTNFTKFLDAAGGADWPYGSSDTVDWPSGTQGAQGNGGVAACIAKKSGSIGYVDFSDAKAQGLAGALIQNSAGEYVEASLSGASAAVEGAVIGDDLTFDPINAPGSDAYPITSPTWIIVLDTQRDSTKAEALRALLSFILTDGQDVTFTQSLNYAPLPAELATRALAQIDQIKVG